MSSSPRHISLVVVLLALGGCATPEGGSGSPVEAGLDALDGSSDSATDDAGSADRELDGTARAVPDADEPPADAPARADGDPGGNDGDPGVLSLSGLEAEVRVLRDDLGIPHIYADSAHDLFFAQAYVHCLDRFPQMELLRRVGTGRLAELVYGLSAGSVVDDAMTRTLGFARVAQQQLDALDPAGEARQALDAYAAGVNAFIDQVRSGERDLPTPYSFVIKPHVLADWTPVDTLAIGRVQAYDLAFDGFREIALTAQAQAIVDAFPPGSPEPALSARAGYIDDVFRFAPTDRTVQFEDYAPVLGTGLFAATGPGSAPASHPARRPHVPDALLQRAAGLNSGWRPLLGHLGAPSAGGGMSNSWAVHGSRTASGFPMVCNDPHLSLPNPPLFHLSHLVVAGDVDAIGGNFPGVPGLLIGYNRHVAWTLTTASDDRSDVYLEDFVAGADGAPPTVRVDGVQQPVSVLEDSVAYGSLGELQGTLDFDILVTPKGRVLVPNLTPTGQIPLQTGPQLSFAWTGFEPTPEINAVIGALRAGSAGEIVDLYDQFHVANQCVTGGDTSGKIYATVPGGVPLRGPGAFTYDPLLAPDGTAPWWILPGDDDADWIGALPPDQGPRVINPGKGFVVTANNDHVGQTLDGDPKNEPFYLGYDYSPGLRAGRITRLLDGTAVGSPAAEGALVGLAEMRSIQTDTRSNLAERLRDPVLLDITALVEEQASPGTHAELSALAAQHADRADAIAAGLALIQGWDGETPAGLDAQGTPDGDLEESSAASLWNYLVIALIDELLGDERAVIGGQVDDRMTTNALVALIENQPGEVASLDPATSDSILWDRLDTPDRYERRSEIVGAALVAALQASDERYGVTPLDQRPWGEVHGLNLEALVPLPGGGGDLPAPGHPRNGLGYPRPGDQWAVNVCNAGLSDTDFRCSSGAIMRLCVELAPSGPKGTIMLPGGQSMDAASPWYASLLTGWLDHEARSLHFAADDVDAHATETLIMRPAPTAPGAGD